MPQPRDTAAAAGIKVAQLRNYIGIASPPRREPAHGDEPSMRVSLSFEPAWFHDRCGVVFREKWHRDPYYRYSTLKRMKAELLKSFPAAHYWDPDDDVDLGTINGVYGAFPVPYVIGMSLIFGETRYPTLDPATRFSVEQMESLDADKVLQGPGMEEIFRQMEIIGKEWGRIHGYLNWQGVLNNGFNLRGPDIFIDMIDKPELTTHFFEVITDIMIRMVRSIQIKQRASGFNANHISIANCVMNMISPEMYEEKLLQFDTRIADSFEIFGVHTCEWDVTPYLEVLKKLPKVGYLDMGMMSDMPRVKAEFPDARRAVLYSASALRDKEFSEITWDMEKIHRELAPCDVVVPDIINGTPDKRVNDFIDLCATLSEKELPYE